MPPSARIVVRKDLAEEDADYLLSKKASTFPKRRVCVRIPSARTGQLWNCGERFLAPKRKVIVRRAQPFLNFVFCHK